MFHNVLHYILWTKSRSTFILRVITGRDRHTGHDENYQVSAERKADILPLVRLTHQEVPQTSIPIEKEAPSWKCCFRVRLPDALVIHVATYQHVQAELSDHLAVATGHPDNFVVRYYSYESDVLAAKSDAQAVGSSVLELLGFSEVQIDTQLLVEPYMRSPDLHPI